MAKVKSNASELVGQTFGKWAVLKRSGSQNDKALWLCRCECGNESHVTTGNLRFGTSRHCRSCASRNYHAVSQTDLTSHVFGAWTVVRRNGSTSAGKAVWLCRCACGNESNVPTGDLKSGKSLRCRSCSTAQFQTTHGHTVGGTTTRTFRCWNNMMIRCGHLASKKPNASQDRYAKRGITVCGRWRTFANFLADMGECPSDKHSVDRIDNDGNYEPSNCHWATGKEQMRNMSRNRHIEYQGEIMCVAEAAERFGIVYKTLIWRLDSGWSIDMAIETPVRNHTSLLRC